MQQPVGGKGQFVVVVRVAFAQKTQNVLVDEIEVPEAVDAAQGGVVADGVALVGITQAGQNVPGSGDGQKKEQAADRLQRPPAPPLAAQQKKWNRRRGKEDRGDQPLGQESQRQRRPHSIKMKRSDVFQPGQQAVEGRQQKKAELRLRNGEARVEKRPDRGENAESGVEAGAASPGAARPEPGQPGAAQQGQRIGQVGGKDVLAEDAIERGVEPVGQRRFLQVADAVDLQRHPVAALGHVLRGLGMAGVGVVQQGRRKQRGKLHGGEDHRQKRPCGQRGR